MALDTMSFVTWEQLAFIGLTLVSAWVYRDADKKGHAAGRWALATFLLVIIFLPAYLMYRDFE